jgi:hypothetical protein
MEYVRKGPCTSQTDSVYSSHGSSPGSPPEFGTRVCLSIPWLEGIAFLRRDLLERRDTAQAGGGWQGAEREGGIPSKGGGEDPAERGSAVEDAGNKLHNGIHSRGKASVFHPQVEPWGGLEGEEVGLRDGLSPKTLISWCALVQQGVPEEPSSTEFPLSEDRTIVSGNACGGSPV